MSDEITAADVERYTKAAENEFAAKTKTSRQYCENTKRIIEQVAQAFGFLPTSPTEIPRGKYYAFSTTVCVAYGSCEFVLWDGLKQVAHIGSNNASAIKIRLRNPCEYYAYYVPCDDAHAVARCLALILAGVPAPAPEPDPADDDLDNKPEPY